MMKNNILESINSILSNTEKETKIKVDEIANLIQGYKSNQADEEDNYFSLNELMSDSLSELKEQSISKDRIDIGFDNLKHLIHGFDLGEFIVLGGRPSMGKTTLLLNLALTISKSRPTLFFTYDLSKKNISSRILSNLSKIELDKIQYKSLSKEEIEKVEKLEKELTNYNLFINESRSNSLFDFKVVCEKLIKNHKIEVVFIDFIQLMTNNEKSSRREQEISHISRELKNLAKTNNICIVASSQLSRAVESRGGDKKPILSDLRESGAIEQDADKVLLIYRPEYYNFTIDENGFTTKNRMEVIIAKNRMGPIGSIDLKYDFNTASLTDYHYTEDSDAQQSFLFSKERLNEINNKPF